MDSNEKNNIDNDTIDKIVEEVISVLCRTRHPDISLQMTESKEEVFSRVSKMIKTETSGQRDKNTRTNLLTRLSFVAASTLLIIAIGSLTYFAGYHSGIEKLSAEAVNVEVPLGVISRLTLSDGTKIVLNGGSKLTYPSAFNGKRIVHLSGEGFFDVAKDEKNPFIVQSKNISARVLGTRFSFKAYEEDAQTTLTLEAGCVSVCPSAGNMKDDILLKPNQQILFDNATGEFQRRNVPAEDYVSWKDGVLIFRDQTLAEIGVVLGRRFGIRLDILSDTIGNQKYGARFKDGESVEEILDKLSHKRSWKYKKQQGRIEIVNR